MARQLTQSAWDAKRAEAKAAAKAASAKSAEDEQRDAPEDTTGATQPVSDEKPYTEWTDEELQEEFSTRQLEFEDEAEGTRAELIAALEADDNESEEE